MRNLCLVVSLLCSANDVVAEETFVTIQKVAGNHLAVTKDAAGAGPRGRRGGGAELGGVGRGRGRGRSMTASQPIIVAVPGTAKVTTAMRERRTFEFRVGAELAGGLRHRIFRNMTQPLQARIVTEGNRVTEVNVITSETDINQSNTNASGQTVIAVRPKRPPVKVK